MRDLDWSDVVADGQRMRDEYMAARRCAQSGRRVKVTDSADRRVPNRTLTRICTKCGNQVELTTDANSWAVVPEHSKTTGSWLDEV
jgi:hypothetical protein